MLVRELGRERFEEGLRAATLGCKFFPLPAEIREYAPAPQPRSDGALAEFKELQRRAASGEQFFGLRDLLEQTNLLQAAKSK